MGPIRFGSRVLDSLTTTQTVVILSNMKAELLLRERHLIAEDAFVEFRIWRVPNAAAKLVPRVWLVPACDTLVIFSHLLNIFY